ncbi:MAG TPA: hypothetical protein VIH30_00730 [Aquirhabdus sp.]
MNLFNDLIVSPIQYGLCLSEKSFKKTMNEIGLSKIDRPDFMASNTANATAHIFYEHNIVVVCVKKNKDTTLIQMAGLIIHESVHIWQWIKEHIGEVNPSKEFEAYSIQRIAQTLLSEYIEANNERAR